jgi:replicative DNA helicase
MYDKTATIEVLGCLIKKPDLILDENYKITIDDFSEKFHKIVFGSINNLIMNGVKKIDPIILDEFISKYEKQYKTFCDNNGFEYVEKIIEISSFENFEYNYKILKKYTVLREIKKKGFDISYFYDEDILDFKLQEEIQKRFNESTVQDIIDYYDKKILEIKTNHYEEEGQIGHQAAKGMKDLKEELKKVPEMGVPVNGHMYNTIIRGARIKKLYMRSSESGGGKAIPNTTIIPTPDGDKMVGDIKKGDYIFGDDGKPVKVIQVHPQKEKKEIYEVYLKDGRVAECCEEHLWQYYDRGVVRVEDTKTIQERSLRAGGFKAMQYKFKIPLNKPVEYPEREYLVSPYSMGLIIGNSDFRYDDVKLEYFNLRNKDSYEIFIPEEYLLGSVSQRQSLFQGLLDANENIDEEGFASFITTSSKMVESIVKLCNSLGMVATFKQDERDVYTLKCLLEKKDYIHIEDIKKTGKFVEMTCFTVDNVSHLFLMNDFIVTHNTRYSVGDACLASVGVLYDSEANSWVDYNLKEPTLFISTELAPDEIQTMMIAFISDVNEAKILKGSYTKEEERRIDKAIELIEASSLWIEQIPNFNIEDIERTVKKYKLEHNIGYVYFDYIFTSVKMLTEIAQKTKGMRLREDNVLYIFAERMKFLCNNLKIHFSTSSQLNGDWESSKNKNQNLLRGSKAIADKLDVGVIVLEPTKKDYECVEHILNNGFYKKPNRIYHIYKVRRGKLNRVMVWTYADLGTCRSYDQFITDKNYDIIDIETTDIEKILIDTEIEKILENDIDF